MWWRHSNLNWCNWIHLNLLHSEAVRIRKNCCCIVGLLRPVNHLVKLSLPNILLFSYLCGYKLIGRQSRMRIGLYVDKKSLRRGHVSLQKPKQIISNRWVYSNNFNFNFWGWEKTLKREWAETMQLRTDFQNYIWMLAILIFNFSVNITKQNFDHFLIVYIWNI